MITQNEAIKEAINNEIITLKMSLLFFVSEFKDDGATATSIAKHFNASYTHVNHLVKMFVRNGYLYEIPSIDKRIRSVVLTQKAYDLFNLIGCLNE